MPDPQMKSQFREGTTAWLLPAAAALIFLITPWAAGAAGPERWIIHSAIEAEKNAVTAIRYRGGDKSSHTLEVPAPGFSHSPAITLDGQGGAAAVWVGSGDGRERIFLSLFNGETWSRPSAIWESRGTLTLPAASFSDAGGLWITWTYFDGHDDEIMAAFYHRGALQGTWPISDNTLPDITPSITGLEEDGASLVWYGYDGRRYRLCRRIFRGGTWSGKEYLSGPVEGPLRPPSFFRNKAGGAQLVTGLDRESTETDPGGSFPFPWGGMPEDLTVPGDTAAGAAWIGPSGRWSGIYLPRETAAAPMEIGRKTTLREGTAAPVPYDRTIFLGLGDSVTFGRGSSADGPPTDYISRLEKYLKGPWIGKNAGIPGSTSARLLNRVNGDLDDNSPGLSILMIGVNDAFLGISPQTTITNIKRAAKRIKKRGGHLLISTTTPVLPSSRPTQYQRLAALNPLIIDLANAKGYPLIDTWKIITSKKNWQGKFMEPVAGNHLNNKGYNRLAKKMRKKILEAELLSGDMSWKAVEPLQPGQMTEEDNTPTSTYVDDPVTSLAGDEITAISALDVDGDGVDEVAVIASQGLTQSFRLYSAPPAGSLTPLDLAGEVNLLAEDQWIYPGRGRITHLFGLDMDGDGPQEVGLVLWEEDQKRQVLEIWTAHQPGVDTFEEAQLSQRMLLDRWRIPRDGRIRDIAPIQVDLDPEEEVAVLAEKDLSGEQSILIFDTPPLFADNEVENDTELLYRNKWTVKKRILRLVGQNINENIQEELILLRAQKPGRFDKLEAYHLPNLPALNAGNSELTLLAKDRWVRSPDPHICEIESMSLDDGLGGLVESLAIWRNN